MKLKKHLVSLAVALVCAFLSSTPGRAATVSAEETRVTIHADQVLFRLSDMMIGANMEDLHYQMVGGLDSQLIHGESFFEPSPTQLAPKAGIVDGFDNCGGSVALENGELVLGKGTRLTGSTLPAISLQSTAGAGVAVCVSPNNSDNKWEWYSGYTAMVMSNQVILSRSTRANRNTEVAQAAVTVGDWFKLYLRAEQGVVTVRVDDREVIRYVDEKPLAPGLVAILARGPARIRGDFHPNPLLKTPGDAISLRWAKVQTGKATGNFALETDGAWFKNSPSQTITLTGGDGEWGIDNAGLQRWGINLIAGKPYEGFLRVKAAQPTELWVSLRKADGTVVAQEKLVANGNYQRLAFALTPSAGDEKGRFAITLKKPGSITVGYAFLQTGEWGRYKGLPVRKDLAEALLAQGIRVLRLNGGMIEVRGYRWRNMRGPRDERLPYGGFYDRYCSSGFGPAEAVAFGKAAGLTVIPALNLAETPEDVADFVATCRPPLYQVANESRFNQEYVEKFKLVAEAVWKVAPDITLITTSTRPKVRETDSEAEARQTLAPHLDLAEFARKNGKHIMFDSHCFDGAPAVQGSAVFARWLQRLAPDPKLVSVGTLELNAVVFGFEHGLYHALEMNAAYRAGDVIRAVTMANLSNPWGIYQPDWKSVLWTGGNIYYTPTKVWFQPAYYVDQMIANAWAPNTVAVESTASPQTLDVFAAKSADGSKLVMRFVNTSKAKQTVRFDIQGVMLGKSPARVSTLAHVDLTDFNTESQPERIKPVTTEWQLAGNLAAQTLPPHSFTVIEQPLDIKETP